MYYFIFKFDIFLQDRLKDSEMNKSKNFPHISEEKVASLRKSSSLKTSDVSENSFIYEEEFEGDGKLGIKFGGVNGKVVVKSIRSRDCS